MIDCEVGFEVDILLVSVINNDIIECESKNEKMDQYVIEIIIFIERENDNKLTRLRVIHSSVFFSAKACI